MLFRHGSNALDSSSPTERSGLVTPPRSEGSRCRSRQTLRGVSLSEAHGSESALERSEGVTRVTVQTVKDNSSKLNLALA